MASPRSPDLEIARIAAAQYGLITWRQLRRVLGEQAIRRRIATGRLHGIYRGVYAVGHPVLRREGQWLAAVLAFGGNVEAALSHLSAAAFWGLRPDEAPGAEVMLLRNTGRRHRPARSEHALSVGVHRSRTITPSQTVLRGGIRVTTVERTLHDIRRRIPPHEFIRAQERAQADYGLVPPTRGPGMSRSDAEVQLRLLCVEHGIAQPLMNRQIAGEEVDFSWPEHRVVVELDSKRFHRTDAAFERDRRKAARVRLAGFEVIRVSYRQLTEEPTFVAALLSVAVRGTGARRP